MHAPAPGVAKRHSPPRFGNPTHAGCRDNEWLLAFCMVGWAAVLALPGDSLAQPAYVFFDRMGLGEGFWGSLFASCGCIRVVALWINGKRPQTPIFRMLGAAVGFLAWMQLGISLAVGSWISNRAGLPVTGVYAVFTLAELRSFFRAGYDARYLR